MGVKRLLAFPFVDEQDFVFALQRQIVGVAEIPLFLPNQCGYPGGFHLLGELNRLIPFVMDVDRYGHVFPFLVKIHQTSFLAIFFKLEVLSFPCFEPGGLCEKDCPCDSPFLPVAVFLLLPLRTIVFPFRSELADYTYEEWTLDYDAGAYVFETEHVVSWTRGIGFFRDIAHIRVY